MTKTIEFSWDAWVAKNDPDHAHEKIVVVEYEFTARGLPLEPDGDARTFLNGQRVFRGNYQQRGAYAEAGEYLTDDQGAVLYEDDGVTPLLDDEDTP